MSKTSSCGWKNALTEQSDAGQFATGMPSVEVSTLVTLPCNWLGMEVRWSPRRSGFAPRSAAHTIDTHVEVPDTTSKKRQDMLRQEREARARGDSRDAVNRELRNVHATARVGEI
ncbi:hypothetical protein TRAPUB_7312 [Trametes pubescens]|uniref:Uncharacterized protein n=1 Tax=Trametes pubescens TaxID=154538 RepID=A0A1M2V3R7_TRAPU|nr:hypothetical protein TRAPUB_7312 [Trametes pubescens]